MELDIYQIDAFAQNSFEGNPAAVCPLESWLDDDLMQNIALENNLSETAFFVKEGDIFHIRWFTPTVEVDMCGHATLASAYVLFNNLSFKDKEIVFTSKSGILKVTKNGELLEMDFPAQDIKECEVPLPLMVAFDAVPCECYEAMDYIVVFDDEKDIQNAKPDLSKLKELPLRGVIITAKSQKYDFVSRFFAPNAGVDEDPVTGSSFTQLVPYWAKVLKNKSFHAKQISHRGGEVFCELDRDRVKISGYCVLYLQGNINIS